MTRPAAIALGAAAAAMAVGVIGASLTLALAAAALGPAVLLREARRASLAAGRAAGPSRWLPAIAGALLIGLRVALAGPPSPLVALPTGSGPWLAVVESVGSPKAGSRPATVVIEEPAGLRVAANLPWYPEIAPGDRIEISGSIEPRPDGDYGEYLRRIGASGTVRARSLRLAPNQPDTSPWETLRRASAAALDRSIPAPESGLADGILVGLRDRVDRDLAAAFTTAGVSHIVAISGWNIAIVATTLGALTGRLGRRRRTLATGAAILAYVAFVGPSASVVRAAAMAGCALLARELGRPTTATAAMGVAVTGLLAVDPAYIDDAGFRLSVLATAGLIAWGSRLSRWLAGPTPGRSRAWLSESLGVSLAAQAATLPVILLDFGRLSIVSPAVNLVVAPFVAPAMAAGGVALVVGLGVGAGLPAALAMLAGLPAWLLLGVIVGVVRFGAGLPFASVSLEPPANVVGAGVALVAVWALARHRRPRAAAHEPAPPHATVLRPRVAADALPRRSNVASRAMAGLLGVASLAVGVAAIHRPDGTTRITVLDVGQGDAILVEGGRGGRLLVDGGPDPRRLLVALDEHLPPWDRRLDAVVLTHPHEDHVAGLALLLARYRVGRVFEPGMIGPGPGYAAWNAALTGSATGSSSGGAASAGGLASNDLTRWALGTGDRLTVDDIELRVLWPDPGAVPLHPADGGTAINNVSIVLLGEVAGHRFLLAGDIEQGIDPTLIARGLPTLDFLKVAHHGSGTASTQAFLEAVRPRVAAVSAGAGNPYGHPAPATIVRLRGVAQQVYRTDLDGAVTVAFDGPVMRVHAAGGRAVGAAPIASPAPQLGAALFACAVPARPGLTSASRPVDSAPAVVGVAARSTPPIPASPALPHPPPPPGRGPTLLYHRLDDGTLPGGGGPPVALPRSTGLASAAFARRRGGGRLARPTDLAREPDAPAGSRAGRGGRAPP
jgi:competence protein ComEC